MLVGTPIKDAMIFVGGIGFAGKSTLVSSAFIALLRRIVIEVLVFSTL